MAVRETRSGLVPFVDDRLDVREPLSGGLGRTRLPGFRHPHDLVGLELCERADVPRRRDDDFLVSACWAGLEKPDVPWGPSEVRGERGKLVRNDPDEPAGRVGARSGGPSANVSGGVRSSCPSQKGQFAMSTPAVAPGDVRGAPGRRERSGAMTTHRPESGSRRSSRPSGSFSRRPSPSCAPGHPSRSRGRTRSSGSGRMIIDERSELISSIVCR